MKFSVGQFFAGYVRKQGLRLLPGFFEVGELVVSFVVVLTLRIVDIEKVPGHCGLAVQAKARGPLGVACHEIGATMKSNISALRVLNTHSA